MELMDIMKQRREILSLTQQDLAEMSQVGLATIKDIERGKGNPALKTVKKILDVLGIEIEQMIKADGLLEYAKYVDHYYGTPKSYVNEQLSAGKNVILEIEIQGALKIKKQFPDTVLMFVSAPSADELKDRLVGRGTETKEVCAQRLSRAYEESLGIEKYDYLVVNDKLDDCVELVNDIIHSSDDTKKNQDYLVSSNIDFINKMRKELLSFSKGDK